MDPMPPSPSPPFRGSLLRSNGPSCPRKWNGGRIIISFHFISWYKCCYLKISKSAQNSDFQDFQAAGGGAGAKFPAAGGGPKPKQISKVCCPSDFQRMGYDFQVCSALADFQIVQHWQTSKSFSIGRLPNRVIYLKIMYQSHSVETACAAYWGLQCGACDRACVLGGRRSCAG